MFKEASGIVWKQAAHVSGCVCLFFVSKWSFSPLHATTWCKKKTACAKALHVECLGCLDCVLCLLRFQSELIFRLPLLSTGDETYQDIFQDFTQMASNDPDKLNRFQPYDSPRQWGRERKRGQRGGVTGVGKTGQVPRLLAPSSESCAPGCWGTHCMNPMRTAGGPGQA